MNFCFFLLIHAFSQEIPSVETVQQQILKQQGLTRIESRIEQVNSDFTISNSFFYEMVNADTYQEMSGMAIFLNLNSDVLGKIDQNLFASCATIRGSGAALYYLGGSLSFSRNQGFNCEEHHPRNEDGGSFVYIEIQGSNGYENYGLEMHHSTVFRCCGSIENRKFQDNGNTQWKSIIIKGNAPKQGSISWINITDNHLYHPGSIFFISLFSSFQISYFHFFNCSSQYPGGDGRGCAEFRDVNNYFMSNGDFVKCEIDINPNMNSIIFLMKYDTSKRSSGKFENVFFHRLQRKLSSLLKEFFKFTTDNF